MRTLTEEEKEIFPASIRGTQKLDDYRRNLEREARRTFWAGALVGGICMIGLFLIFRYAILQ